jgi:hypothetical protein
MEGEEAMELRIEQASWLKPPKKWVLLKRLSRSRLGWDAIGAFETKREAQEALKQRKSEESN